MDDDSIAFFVIFGVIMMSVFAATYGYVSSIQIFVPQPSAIAMQDNNVTRMKRITMPTPLTVIPLGGIITDGVSSTFFIYNPNSFPENVTITWWLSSSLENQTKWVSFYCELSQPYTIQPLNVTECYVSFSIMPNTPIYERAQLENAGLFKVVNIDLKVGVEK